MSNDTGSKAVDRIDQLAKAFAHAADEWFARHPRSPQIREVALHLDRSGLGIELEEAYDGMHAEFVEQTELQLNVLRSRASEMISGFPDSALPLTILVELDQFLRSKASDQKVFHTGMIRRLDFAGSSDRSNRFTHTSDSIEGRLEAFRRIDSLCDMDPDDGPNRLWTIVRGHRPIFQDGGVTAPSMLDRRSIDGTSYVMARTAEEACLKAALLYLGYAKFNASFDDKTFDIDGTVTVHDVLDGNVKANLAHSLPIQFENAAMWDRRTSGFDAW